MRINLRGSACAAALILAGSACADPNALEQGDAPDITTTDEGREAAFASYMHHHVKVVGNGDYVVEGDTLRTGIDEVRAEFDARFPAPSALLQELDGTIRSQWPEASKRNVTYCVSTAFNSEHDAVRDTMYAATAAWENIADVRYTYRPEFDSNCSDSNASVTFNIRPSGFFPSGEPERTLSFYPHEPRGKRRLALDMPKIREQQARRSFLAALTHELGHTLGFRHEHMRVTPEASLCEDRPPGDPFGPVDRTWVELTPYDTRSVMHYPDCPDTGTAAAEYTISQRDVDGAQRLYGAPSHVISAGSEIYARRMSDGILFRRDGTTWRVVQSSAFDPGQRFRSIIGVSHGIYALRSDGSGVVYIPNGDGYVSTTQVGGPAAQVYACPNETVCATNPDTADIWMFNRAGNFWSWLGGPGKRFALGGDKLYALTPDGKQLNRWTQASGWQVLVGPFTSSLTELMPTSSTADLTYVMFGPLPFRWQGGSTFSYLNIAGLAQLEARASSVYAITLDRANVVKLSGTTWNWSASAVTRLFGGPSGSVLALALDNQIWQNNGTSWTSLGRPQ